MKEVTPKLTTAQRIRCICVLLVADPEKGACQSSPAELRLRMQ